VLTSACAVSGLSFVADDRVHIVHPDPNAEVSQPFELDWTASDVDGSFAVFFDRTPMRPGQTLRSIVADGDPCLADASCPDASWLAERNIYVTDSTELTVELLADLRKSNHGEDLHDVTIVLLDEQGRRVGESAFSREFIVRRED
jgi:hypothetical protein